MRSPKARTPGLSTGSQETCGCQGVMTSRAAGSALVGGAGTGAVVAASAEPAAHTARTGRAIAAPPAAAHRTVLAMRHILHTSPDTTIRISYPVGSHRRQAVSPNYTPVVPRGAARPPPVPRPHRTPCRGVLPGCTRCPGGTARVPAMDKVVSSAAEAVDGIVDGSSLSVGGFGLCGIPTVLIKEIHDRGVTDLEAVSNNCGVDDWGLGILLKDKRIRRMISSYVGENKEFERQYLSGELEVELTPQGTLAERLRAGGSGTQVAEGGLPWRYAPDGSVAKASPAKDTREFAMGGGQPRTYVLEEAIVTDFGLVRAWKGDRHGNLVYRQSARNFNPLAAMCGRVTIAEVEELVEPGELDPNNVHTPGVFVQRVVALTPEQAADKRIEKRTVRPREAS